MTPETSNFEFTNFEILFQKLEEAKKEQDENFIFNLTESQENHDTISLFKDYQETLAQPSYATFMRG